MRSESYKLLRRASSERWSGNLDAAIESLRLAQRRIAQEGAEYPVVEYLRLPNYLSEAGRYDEAYAELHRLLDIGYPNQLFSREVRALDDSRIYSQLCSLLQSQNRGEEAIQFGVMSMISFARTNAHDKNTEPEDRIFVEIMLTLMLELADRMDLMDQLMQIVQEASEKPDAVDVYELGRRVDSLVAGR